MFEADCESKHMAFTCTRTKNTYVVYGSTWFKCTWSKVFSEVRNSWTYCFSDLQLVHHRVGDGGDIQVCVSAIHDYTRHPQHVQLE